MWARRFRAQTGWAVALNAYALLLALILIYPTIQLVIVAVSDDIVFPPRYFSLAAFEDLSQAFWDSVKFSLLLGAVTTAGLIALCLPTAYAVERFHFRARGFVSAAVFIPFVLPGLGYMAAVGTVYILYVPVLMGTFLGVFFPTALFNLAWMTRAIQGSLATADPVYEEAAMTLGASRLHAFFSITLPHVAPGLIVGAMIVFTNSATAFIAPLFVGRVQSLTATVEIFREMDQHGLTPVLAAQSLLVEIVVMSLVLGGYLVSKRHFRGLVL
jgi:ABC-type spermidine/putrescine transport system permease subunit II